MSKESTRGSIIAVRALCDVCKEVNIFQFSKKDLLPHLGGLYQVSTTHQCSDGKEMVLTIVLDRNYAVRQTTASPFVAGQGTDRLSAERVVDINFLLKRVKDAEEAIHAVLSSKQVIVAGKTKQDVQRIVHTLELFAPTKFASSVDWTEEKVTDLKIVGTTKDNLKYYKKAIIVDLDERKVLRGTPSPYCEQLLSTLVSFEPNAIAYATNLKIDMLIQFAKMLIDLSKEEEIGSRALELIKMDVSSDALELIKDIVEGFDHTAADILREDWL